MNSRGHVAVPMLLSHFLKIKKKTSEKLKRIKSSSSLSFSSLKAKHLPLLRFSNKIFDLCILIPWLLR